MRKFYETQKSTETDFGNGLQACVASIFHMPDEHDIPYEASSNLTGNLELIHEWCTANSDLYPMLVDRISNGMSGYVIGVWWVIEFQKAGSKWNEWNRHKRYRVMRDGLVVHDPYIRSEPVQSDYTMPDGFIVFASTLDPLAFFSQSSHILPDDVSTIILKDDLKELNSKAEVLAKMQEYVHKTSEAQDVYLSSNRSTLEQARILINNVTRRREKMYDQVIRFGDQVTQQLAGMRIVVDGVLSAETHREKDARLRGLLDVIETGIDRLQEKHINDFNHLHSYFPHGLFAADTSRVRLQHRVWELEKQIEELRNQVANTDEGSDDEDLTLY